MNDLRKDIETAINRHSAENGSDTPDFILAEYLIACLAAYDQAVTAREKWYGRACGSVKDTIPVDEPPPSVFEDTSRREVEAGVVAQIKERVLQPARGFVAASMDCPDCNSTIGFNGECDTCVSFRLNRM